MSDACPDLKSQLREQRISNRLAAERLRGHQLAAAERRAGRRDLRESYFDGAYPSALADVLDRRGRMADDWGGTAAARRTRGTNFPVYQSEGELAILRGASRVMCATNSYAQAMVEGLTSYVIGTGCTYRAAPRQGADAPPELVEACQRALDEFDERTEWHGGELPGLEEELFGRSLEDGEFVLVHSADEWGRTEVRVAEPEYLTAPPDPGDWPHEGWSFGVRTDPADVQRPLGYWLQWAPGDGREYTPDEVTHYRRGVRRGMKRGVPDFSFDTYDALSLAADLRTTLADTAAQQASIVAVTQYETAGRPEVERLLGDEEADDPRPLAPIGPGGRALRRGPRRGTWEHLSKGQSYAAGPSASNGSVHLAIMQAALRSAGVKWNAPEWLISGDASNNNYASSLTAENPFVRTVVRRQRSYAEAFRRTRLVVLRNLCDAGRLYAAGRLWLWAEVLALVTVVATAPSPETRNRLEEAQRNQVEVTLGYSSPQQCAEQQGYDWERVQSDRLAAGLPKVGLTPTASSPPQNPAAPG